MLGNDTSPKLTDINVVLKLFWQNLRIYIIIGTCSFDTVGNTGANYHSDTSARKQTDIVKVDCDNESEEKEVDGSESTADIQTVPNKTALISDIADIQIVPNEKAFLGADKVAHVLGGDKVDVHAVLTLFWPNLLIHLIIGTS